jgi:LysR family transcriptional regulator, glycine cleavage system transcriptional activator
LKIATMQRLPGLPAFRVFEAAARNLSFSRAAATLGVTPAAVSSQIRALEDQLGVVLFTRTSRQMQLTDAGKLLFAGVSEAFATLTRTIAQLSAADGTTLRVACSASIAAKWLLPRLGRFRAAHPGVDVVIDANDALIDLNAVGAAVAIRFGHGHYPGMRTERLFEEYVFPVCSPALLAGPHPLRTPSDLRFHQLIHLEWQASDATWPDWRSWLLAAGVADVVDSSRGLRLTTFALASQEAIVGHGVALGNTSLVGDDLASGRLVRPFELSLKVAPDYAYYIVTPLALAERPLVAAFRTWALAEARGEEGAPAQPS